MNDLIMVSKRRTLMDTLRARQGFVPEAIVFMIILGVAAVAHSEESAWSSLNRQVMELHTAGRAAEALPIAERALGVAEKEYGAGSPEMALSLNNLALTHKKRGDHAKAAGLYRRSLEISEKIVGPKSPELLVAFNNLAVTYEAMGEHEKADAIYRDVRSRGHAEWADKMEARSGEMRGAL